MMLYQRLMLGGRRRPSLPCRASLPVNGERDAGRYDGTFPAASATGEILDEGVLLPVYGEKSRQGMRGSADAECLRASAGKA
jgi:hypothetical protein